MRFSARSQHLLEPLQRVAPSVACLKLGRSGLLVALLVSLLHAVPTGAETAQTSAPQNPLEMNEPDPLLPRLAVERPLSPQERSVLATALNALQAQAAAKLQAGDIAGAFQLWNRELRLRRFLGAEEEVTALSRVGEVAWRQSETTELRIVIQRLQQIQQQIQAQTPVNYGLLLKIAQAYQTMRARDPAVALYQQLLAQAKQRQNLNRQAQILKAMGDLQLAWFDYANAATSYEELLSVARAKNDAETELTTLQQLARVYQEGSQPQKAAEVQQRLVDYYQKQRNFLQIPPLKLSIGDNYLALNRPDLAAPSYQEAYATARSVQQYGYAADALKRLADLYRSLNRVDDTLVVYQLLLDVQKQSYDNLGMLNTYDQIGQLYRNRGQKDQARSAFQQGLQLAQQLNYKVDYFSTQIQGMSQ